MRLKIGTRGSRLALSQSEWVRDRIEAQHADVTVELVKIKTTGDKILDSPLSKIGGKGLFVKEIEEALLEERVDLAVHSMKDLPGELPEGLTLPVFPEREEPRDAFISMKYRNIEELPDGALVGTSSLRRTAQLLRIRPDLTAVPLRGNVDTRLRKLEAGEIHAVILAAAGLRRLGLEGRITWLIPAGTLLPAIGQGALGLEVRTGDDDTLEKLAFFNHPSTEVAVRAERSFQRRLEGGCQVPIAAHGRVQGERLVLKGLVSELDGTKTIEDEMEGEDREAEEIGAMLAERMIGAGAGEILEKIYGGQGRG